MIVLGIDPGLSGALASWDGETLSVLEIPTVAATKGRQVDWANLVLSFERIFTPVNFPPDRIKHAFIERAAAMPKQGVASMFKFGYVAGGLRGIVAARHIPVTMVSARTWKRVMGLGASKDAARARASELFPRDAGLFARKKDDGVAEAALIARYGHGVVMAQGAAA